MKTMGIYCHIPFCIRKCSYCDFSSFDEWDEDLVKTYFNRLWSEIEKKKSDEFFVDTIYFGGGTPSAVDACYILESMKVLKKNFIVLKEAEITIEINPGTLSLEKAKIYAQAGFNRVSMGLQAWQDSLLKDLGRIHRQKDFIEGILLLKEVGFKNISVDLMYGLPNQSIEDVLETLEALVTFNLKHLSCYSLILEEGTEIETLEAEGKIMLPSEDCEREMHWMIHHFLREQGYEQYEISSYAKPGYRSRHNLKYWEEVSYLGFGCAAHGFIDNTRYGNPRNLADYFKLVEGEENLRSAETLSESEIMSEWVLLGLRKLEGVDDLDFQKRFGKSFFNLYEPVIKNLIKQGLLMREGSILALTNRGQDFGNQVFISFL